MAALVSPHSDLRLGVLQKLAASQDARVLPALRKALESDRDDVRLLAAQLLAERKDDSAVPALAAFLVPDGPSLAAARTALGTCATDAAALALATHLQELSALPAGGGSRAGEARSSATPSSRWPPPAGGGPARAAASASKIPRPTCASPRSPGALRCATTAARPRRARPRGTTSRTEKRYPRVAAGRAGRRCAPR